MKNLQKIIYQDLNSRQKENFNFQKVAAHLADYGFNCLRLSDDWQGADFIACHIDGDTFLKVQLKGRLTIDRQYSGKNIYIAFFEDGQWYLYPHDAVMDHILKNSQVGNSQSWRQRGSYNWPRLTNTLKNLMQDHAI